MRRVGTRREPTAGRAYYSDRRILRTAMENTPTECRICERGALLSVRRSADRRQAPAGVWIRWSRLRLLLVGRRLHAVLARSGRRRPLMAPRPAIGGNRCRRRDPASKCRNRNRELTTPGRGSSARRDRTMQALQRVPAGQVGGWLRIMVGRWIANGPEAWVEVRGFEPLTSSVRGKRSAGLSYTPKAPEV